MACAMSRNARLAMRPGETEPNWNRSESLVVAGHDRIWTPESSTARGCADRTYGPTAPLRVSLNVVGPLHAGLVAAGDDDTARELIGHDALGNAPEELGGALDRPLDCSSVGTRQSRGLKGKVCERER